AGLRWSVVESVPVHEDIKKQTGDYESYINNYRQSIKNLASCSIYTICYNFMPVTDWTRTDVDYPLNNGATALRFDKTAFAAFELFILERDEAEKDYSAKQQQESKIYYEGLSEDEISQLTNAILLGLPGDDEMTLPKFQKTLTEYDQISRERLQKNLFHSLAEIIPVAEKEGVRMAIHPDDPPFPLFGLPRVVSTEADTSALLKAVDSPSNGLTFCSGSYGARTDNDLPDMIKRLGKHINFIHLRNVKRYTGGSFQEAAHLEGSSDMFQIMKALIREQQRRKSNGQADFNIPLRPDHGHRMLDDLNKESYPGYSGLGRLRGLAELRGLELGVRRALAS